MAANEEERDMVKDNTSGEKSGDGRMDKRNKGEIGKEKGDGRSRCMRETNAGDTSCRSDV